MGCMLASGFKSLIYQIYLKSSNRLVSRPARMTYFKIILHYIYYTQTRV